MGYEIKLIIGKSTAGRPEIARDMNKPYSDGSGFEYKKDKKGNDVLTGKIEHYFSVYAELDLCKIGYADNALNRLNTKSHDPKRRSKHVYYFYGTTEGNKDARKDNYDAPLFPVSLKQVLKSIKEVQQAESEPYRRFTWAIALLESMAQDGEDLEVLFWGH